LAHLSGQFVDARMPECNLFPVTEIATPFLQIPMGGRRARHPTHGVEVVQRWTITVIGAGLPRSWIRRKRSSWVHACRESVTSV
jgi:hypothetical protein